MSIRAILQRAETTQPSAEIKPLHDWETMAAGIRKAQNYLVAAQAEEAKCETDLERARAEREQAETMLEQAKSYWVRASADILGTKVE